METAKSAVSDYVNAQRSLFDADPQSSPVAVSAPSAPRPSSVVPSYTGERSEAQCVVEMRYHSGRLAVPVGAVTIETSGRGTKYIHVGGHLMYTLSPEQRNKFDLHIRE